MNSFVKFGFKFLAVVIVLLMLAPAFYAMKNDVGYMKAYWHLRIENHTDVIFMVAFIVFVLIWVFSETKETRPPN